MILVIWLIDSFKLLVKILLICMFKVGLGVLSEFFKLIMFLICVIFVIKWFDIFWSLVKFGFLMEIIMGFCLFDIVLFVEVIEVMVMLFICCRC